MEKERMAKKKTRPAEVVDPTTQSEPVKQPDPISSPTGDGQPTQPTPEVQTEPKTEAAQAEQPTVANGSTGVVESTTQPDHYVPTEEARIIADAKLSEIREGDRANLQRLREFKNERLWRDCTRKDGTPGPNGTGVGYKSFEEFAEVEYDLDKSSASRYVTHLDVTDLMEENGIAGSIKESACRSLEGMSDRFKVEVLKEADGKFTAKWLKIVAQPYREFFQNAISKVRGTDDKEWEAHRKLEAELGGKPSYGYPKATTWVEYRADWRAAGALAVELEEDCLGLTYGGSTLEQAFTLAKSDRDARAADKAAGKLVVGKPKTVLDCLIELLSFKNNKSPVLPTRVALLRYFTGAEVATAVKAILDVNKRNGEAAKKTLNLTDALKAIDEAKRAAGIDKLEKTAEELRKEVVTKPPKYEDKTDDKEDEEVEEEEEADEEEEDDDKDEEVKPANVTPTPAVIFLRKVAKRELTDPVEAVDGIRVVAEEARRWVGKIQDKDKLRAAIEAVKKVLDGYLEE